MVSTEIPPKLNEPQKRSVLEGLGRQVVGNFTPAYASLLLFGFIFGITSSDESFANGFIPVSIVPLLFTATLAAIGLSAIQPYVLRIVLRPSHSIDEYSSSLARRVMEKTFKKQKISGEKERKTHRLLLSRFKGAYGPRLKEAIGDFEVKKMKMPEHQRSRFENSEARLLAFFYLSLIFGSSIAIGSFKLTFPTLSESISSPPVPTILLSLLGLAVFLLGFIFEVSKYRRATWSTVPVIAAVTDPRQSPSSLQEKVRFVETEISRIADDDSRRVAYTKRLEILNTDLNRANADYLEKKWLDNEVAEEVGISDSEVRNLSEEFAPKAFGTLPTTGRTFRSFATPLLVIGIVLGIFPILIPEENIIPLLRLIGTALENENSLSIIVTALGVGAFLGTQGYLRLNQTLRRNEDKELRLAMVDTISRTFEASELNEMLTFQKLALQEEFQSKKISSEQLQSVIKRIEELQNGRKDQE